MFQRLHDHVEGTGIGLYMVKKMVENAGGSITLQSELGIGTTFFVYFVGLQPSRRAAPPTALLLMNTHAKACLCPAGR